jgi:hypothetical protein
MKKILLKGLFLGLVCSTSHALNCKEISQSATVFYGDVTELVNKTDGIKKVYEAGCGDLLLKDYGVTTIAPCLIRTTTTSNIATSIHSTAKFIDSKIWVDTDDVKTIYIKTKDGTKHAFFELTEYPDCEKIRDKAWADMMKETRARHKGGK